MIKDIPPEFTLQELMAFIEGEQAEVAEGYHTSREWAEHFGVGVRRMREILREARAKDLLDVMSTRGVSDLTGRAHKTWVYAFKSKEKVVA
jgi:DNA-binding FadR family transcriptional regulator